MALELKNPHSVLAALKQRPNAVQEVHVSSQSPSAGWQEVIEECNFQGKPIFQRRTAGKGTKGKALGRRSQAHEGRVGSNYAMVREKSATELKHLFAEDQIEPGIWLALDQVQDPQNVGAIFRSASFFGVKGIIMLKDRAAALSGTVYDISAGGVEYVPFVMQSNMKRALEAAKKAGVWVLGTSERAEKDFGEIQLDRPWLIVLGNEEKGMRRLTDETCDMVCKLSPQGDVHSLNVSVAAAVLVSGLLSRQTGH